MFNLFKKKTEESNKPLTIYRTVVQKGIWTYRLEKKIGDEWKMIHESNFPSLIEEMIKNDYKYYNEKAEEIKYFDNEGNSK